MTFGWILLYEVCNPIHEDSTLRTSSQSFLRPSQWRLGFSLNWRWEHKHSTYRPTHWKRPWCWERLKAGGEGDDGGWDGWIASPTWWTWVWVGSGSWWWTGKPGVVQFMGPRRDRHDWATELNCMSSLYIMGLSFACIFSHLVGNLFISLSFLLYAEPF